MGAREEMRPPPAWGALQKLPRKNWLTLQATHPVASAGQATEPRIQNVPAHQSSSLG